MESSTVRVRILPAAIECECGYVMMNDWRNSTKTELAMECTHAFCKHKGKLFRYPVEMRELEQMSDAVIGVTTSCTPYIEQLDALFAKHREDERKLIEKQWDDLTLKTLTGETR